MPVISLRITKYEKQLLSSMATFYGITVSDLLRRKSMNQIEDRYDALMGVNNYMNYKKHGGKLYTTQDLEKELRSK